MNELMYNIKMTIWFIIIISFVLFRNLRLQNEAMYHWNDFEWLSIDFTISTWAINYSSTGIIYISKNDKSDISFWCLKDIPTECLNENKSSIKCLAKIKEKWYWHYNSYFFKPSDLNCR